MTAQERLDFLLETVSTPTNAAITLATIKGVLPVEAYALVRLTLEAATAPTADTIQANMIAAEMADALSALRTVGLSLSGDDRQAVIDMLAVAGSWPDAVRDAVKALGVAQQARWQVEGYDEAPTLESVSVEIEAEQSATQKQNWKQRFDAALNQIGTNEHAAGIAEVIAIADEMGAA